MLNIPFGRTRLCDGISRRNFLKVGALSFGAVNLTLADVLRAEAAAKKQDPTPAPVTRRSSTSSSAAARRTRTCGKSRPRRPTEIRGEFKPDQHERPRHPDRRDVPADRRVRGQVRRSSAPWSAPAAATTPSSVRPAGRSSRSPRWAAGRASAQRAARFRGRSIRRVPPFVGLAEKTQHVPWSDSGQAGFLGSTYAPFKPSGAGHGEHGAERGQQGPPRRPQAAARRRSTTCKRVGRPRRQPVGRRRRHRAAPSTC